MFRSTLGALPWLFLAVSRLSELDADSLILRTTLTGSLYSQRSMRVRLLPQ
jgi:hypothetical protein